MCSGRAMISRRMPGLIKGSTSRRPSSDHSRRLPVQAAVVEGPETLTAEALFIPHRGNPTEPSAASPLRSWILQGEESVLVVNSASESLREVSDQAE